MAYDAYIQAITDGRIEDVVVHPEFSHSSGSQGLTPMHVAAWNGRDSIIEWLLQQNTSIDAPDIDGYTPFHSATMEGKTSTVELLLRYGSTALDSGNNDGDTPLHLAVCYGQNAMVELLLQHGARLDIGDMNGQTPLYYAGLYENEEAKRILVAVTERGVTWGIPEAEILEIRFRIYFSRSLLSRLASMLR